MKDTDYSVNDSFYYYFKTLNAEDVRDVDGAKIKTNRDAVASGVIEPMYYYTFDDYKDCFVGQYNDNYVLVGVDTLDYLSTILERWEDAYFVGNLDVSSYIKSRQDNFKLGDFLNLPYNIFNKLIFFDTTKNEPNFKDNLVAVPFCASRGSGNFKSVECGYTFLSHKLGKVILIEQKQPKDYDSCFKDAIDRAKTVLQILSRFDYDVATEQDKQILFDLRMNTISMLGDYFVNENGTFSKMLEKKYNISFKNLNYAKHDKYKIGYGKLLLNKDCRDALNYINQFNKLANNGSLSELIEFCKTEPKKFVDSVEERRQQKEIAKEIKNRKEQQKLQEEHQKAEKEEQEKRNRQYKL